MLTAIDPANADTLRHHIALYRSYLSEGVSEALTIVYLNDIASAEAELAELERHQAVGSSTAKPADKN